MSRNHATRSSAKAKRILLVDEDELVMEMNLGRLARMGYKVYGSTSSIEALETFKTRSRKIDLVITEYALPLINGLDLARRMMEVRPGIPIIMFPGYDEADNEQKITEAGIRTCMYKACFREEMASMIQQALERRGARAFSVRHCLCCLRGPGSSTFENAISQE